MTESELRMTAKHCHQVNRDIIKGKMNEDSYIILRKKASHIGWEPQIPNDRENCKCGYHINEEGIMIQQVGSK